MKLCLSIPGRITGITLALTGLWLGPWLISITDTDHWTDIPLIFTSLGLIATGLVLWIQDDNS